MHYGEEDSVLREQIQYTGLWLHEFDDVRRRHANDTCKQCDLPRLSRAQIFYTFGSQLEKARDFCRPSDYTRKSTFDVFVETCRVRWRCISARRSYNGGSSCRFCRQLDRRRLLGFCLILGLLARVHHKTFTCEKVHAAATKTANLMRTKMPTWESANGADV